MATGQRPGYRPGPEFSVPRPAVEEWAAAVQAEGIRSILCLLADDQLPLYRFSLPQGLLSYYAASGFEVAHIGTPDGRTEPFTPEQLDEAWEAFRELPKPVLVHCSAGYDRTGRVVSHILRRLNGKNGANGEHGEF